MSRFRARIAWHGDFLGEGSLARVNRHLARAVIERGEVDVLPCGEPTPLVEESFGRTPCRRESLVDDGLPAITLRHRWPPHFMTSMSAYSVHMQALECGAAPRAWIAPLRARADAVWCHTRYLHDVYVRSGIEPDRAQLLPHGFDPLVYHPGVEPLPATDPDVCVFLYVGGLPWRKNVGAVVQAYLSTFTAGEPVALIVKDAPHAVALYGAERPALLRRLASRTDIPPVRYIEELYSDHDLARLYRLAAALVHPYRGEGFGLPVLEAMACGTPVVVSRGGATDDFVDEDVGYPIPARRIDLGPRIEGIELATDGWYLEPDVAALGAILRRIFERRGEARAKGRNAAARTRSHWTWADAARRVTTCVDALLARPPLPVAPDRERLESYAADIPPLSGTDAMLEELFGRLRVVDPLWVELGSAPDASRTSQLTERYGWRRLRLEPGAGAAALVRHGGREGFDVLALGPDPATEGWALLESHRPRAVVAERPTDAQSTVLDVPYRARYALLARGPNGDRALFLRNDLIPFAGFAPLDV